MWRKSKVEQADNSANEFRADLLEFSKTLTAEINELRDRIHRLEADVISKNKEILRLQSYIGRLGQILIAQHNIHLDDLVKNGA